MADPKDCIIVQICQMALKTFARTKSKSDPKLHFNSSPEEFNSNLQELKQLVNKLKHSDLGLEKSKSIIDPNDQEAPVTYIKVFADKDVSIGIFIVKSGSRIPLHNHPNMHGLLKVVYGSVDIKEYTKWIPNSSADKMEFPAILQEKPHLYEKGFVFPADKKIHTNVDSSYDTHVLSPDENNFHEIHSVGDGPAAFFDILAPPYLQSSRFGVTDDLESAEDEPRDCYFYAEITFETSPSVLPTNPSNRVWLRMIQCPADYNSDTESYLGPPILL